MKTRIPCEYTDEGVRVFRGQRKGLIVGESHDKDCWWVKWNGNKFSQALAKTFIQRRTPTSITNEDKSSFAFEAIK